MERKIWLALAGLFAAGGLAQLPFAPARFGGVFFLALAIGCAGEWLMLGNREKHKTCRVLANVGRVLFGLFVASFAYIQLFVIGGGMHADPQAENADYALVLGALVNPDGRPSAALAARCDTAIEFLVAHPDAKAILCGGQGANEPRAEADAMYDYMVARGVAPGRLLKEDKSNNTIENIRNAREFLSPGDRAAVITNDYHVARARVLMKNAGLDALGIPAPTPYPGQWVAVRCREYCSILGLMLSGRWW
ncbi:YdcF family protein [Agathobaculum sp.]|uniref:YdcF family protein n=1 Tax=Agathobaculum sp. TaxID=2048138 RepID=UPI002A80947D|nr:YdcF family protein [Agathobaculum sp.]MDY3618417.1 YdcF family protein [Agathobaculum sp.]